MVSAFVVIESGNVVGLASEEYMRLVGDSLDFNVPSLVY